MLSCTSTRCGYLNTAPTPFPARRSCPRCSSPLANFPTLAHHGIRVEDMTPEQHQAMIRADASPYQRSA